MFLVLTEVNKCRRDDKDTRELKSAANCTCNDFCTKCVNLKMEEWRIPGGFDSILETKSDHLKLQQSGGEICIWGVSKASLYPQFPKWQQVPGAASQDCLSTRSHGALEQHAV